MSFRIYPSFSWPFNTSPSPRGDGNTRATAMSTYGVRRSELLVPRFALEQSPLDLATWLPTMYEYDFVMACSPQRAFTVLTGQDPLVSEVWFPDYVSTHWLTSGPHGAGSRREYRTKLLTLIEEIDVWTPGKRFAFWVSRASWPIHTRFREIYDLSACPGGTRVRWTVAYEAHPRIAWFTPIGHRLFRGTFDQAVANLEALFPRRAVAA